MKSAVCNSWVATATPTSTSAEPPDPTGHVYVNLYTDSGCHEVLEKAELNFIGECYTPSDSSGNPISFECFAVTYLSPSASEYGSLSVFKGVGCFSQDDSKKEDYANLTDIQYKEEKPFKMGSLSLLGA